MKRRPLFRQLVSTLIPFLAFANLSVAAVELPKRKPGLWEVTTQMDGVPNMGPLQQCVDQNSDELMLQNARKKNCRVIDLKPSGDRVTVRAICTMDGSTATTDGVIEGAFDSLYRARLKTRFSPPWRGRSESNVTHEGRWLGSCKPGQKPGAMIMPSIGGVDLNQIMKDPQVQDLLKRLQRP